MPGEKSGIDFSKFNRPQGDKLTERDQYEDKVMSQSEQTAFGEQTKKERRGEAKNTLHMTKEEYAVFQADQQRKAEALASARVHEDALTEDAIREARKKIEDA